MNSDYETQRKKYIAAYQAAAAEADAWKEVRDRLMWAAARVYRTELGMSLRATAADLGVSKSTLARHAWTEQPSLSDTQSPRARALEDEILIRVGLDALASPQARFAAGLINEYERDALLDHARRQQMPLPDQIREAVETYPGIRNLDLPRMIALAIPEGTVPDLRSHAEAAQCHVDVDSRWWPTCTVADLTPGMQVPHRNDHGEAPGREWVTITNVGPSVEDTTTITVEFDSPDGLPSSWPAANPSRPVAFRHAR